MTHIMLLAQANNNDAAGAGVLGGLLALGAVFWIIALLASIFWIWMLVDVLISNRPTDQKILWFLVVFFLHLIGALVYFFVARNKATTTATGPGTV